MLKMKSSCEKCHAAAELTGVAYICSFECTFCEACARRMGNVCPNCNGELVRRPTRVRKVAAVAVSQLKNRVDKLFRR
jgi:hypothetical protein